MKRILILAVLLALVTIGTAQAASPWDTSLTLTYAHSIQGDMDGLIGKASATFYELKLPVQDTTVKFSVDFLAVPEPETVSCGFGGSLTIETNVLGINVGVGYLPGDYGWSWNCTLISFKL